MHTSYKVYVSGLCPVYSDILHMAGDNALFLQSEAILQTCVSFIVLKYTDIEVLDSGYV